MALNAEATEIFRTIADFLDLLGEKFKPEAYRRAARSIESLTEDLGAVSDRHELRSIPGVGEAIAEKIEEYLRTGSVSYYERLKREIPAGLVELMRLPGLGPKTARRFWVELGVEGPAELRDAIAAGRLVGVKGFGEKKIEQIRSALDSAAAGPGSSARRPIEEVYPVAHALVEALRAGTGADRVEVAGSFRRARETVGDLDILVTTKEPTKVFEVFTAHPLVGEVKMRGETKETVVLRDGLQVDLRVVRPEEFGAALQYFTGSKDHNVRLRSLARDRGLKVNEYGVFRGEERVAGATEEDVYACLGLAWIPPELREGRAEIEEAARGKLPSLVSEADLRGDLHLHPAPDAQPGELERVVAEARARRYTYVGVIVAGVRDDGTYWILSDATRTRLRELAPSGPALVRGLDRARTRTERARIDRVRRSGRAAPHQPSREPPITGDPAADPHRPRGVVRGLRLGRSRPMGGIRKAEPCRARGRSRRGTARFQRRATGARGGGPNSHPDRSGGGVGRPGATGRARVRATRGSSTGRGGECPTRIRGQCRAVRPATELDEVVIPRPPEIAVREEAAPMRQLVQRWAVGVSPCRQ